MSTREKLPLQQGQKNEDWLRRKNYLSNTTLTKPRKVVKCETVLNWLKLSSKMSSHYCRPSTSWVYVESTFMPHRYMHKVYKSWCAETNLESVERKTFNNTLKTEEISILGTLEDQCATCVGFSWSNVSDEEYNLHIAKIEEAILTK